MSFFFFLSVILLATLVVGKALERIRVPWIFAALLLGAISAAFGNPFQNVTMSAEFQVFSQIGMYLLLFLVGLELDIAKLMEKGRFIVSSAFIIIFLEAFLGTLLIHALFGTAWPIAFVVALSFATVGEAILIPILQEFNIVNTRLGQSILGIGTVDDVIELLMLVVASVLVGSPGESEISKILIVLSVLIGLMAGLRLLRSGGRKFKFRSIETLFLFILAVLFLFVAVGEIAHSGPLAALLAGISLRIFAPQQRLKLLDSELKTMAYGLFVPVFFVGVGSGIDISYLVASPLVVLVIVAVSKGAKLVASYFMARKELGTRGSILLGIGLSVRFSTSIVIVTFLYSHGVIGTELFSAVIASSIAFKFIVPILFSRLLVRWGFAKA